ncbi:hypothetical protein AAZX31_04G109900 [Glycine max]
MGLWRCKGLWLVADLSSSWLGWCCSEVDGGSWWFWEMKKKKVMDEEVEWCNTG